MRPRFALLTPLDGFDHGCRDAEHDDRPQPGEPGYDARHSAVLLHAACRFNGEEKVALLRRMGAWVMP